MNPRWLEGTRKHLVQQLIFFDEQGPVFLDTYFPEQGRERHMIEKQIQTYLGALEQVLGNEDELLARKIQETVLLGSSVTIHYEEDGSREEFTVVYPTETDPDRNRVSFLSPIGRQLLLASSGEDVVLETPIGHHRVRVDAIKLAYIGGFSNI